MNTLLAGMVRSCQGKQVINHTFTKPEFKTFYTSDWTTIISSMDENCIIQHGQYQKNLNFQVKSAAVNWEDIYIIDSDDSKLFFLSKKDMLSKRDLDPIYLTEKCKAVASGDQQTVFISDNEEAFIIDRRSEEGFRRVPFPFPSVKIGTVACGVDHVLLLTKIGQVFSFGTGSRGQLGHGDLEARLEPKILEGLETVTVTRIAAGNWHSICLTDSGDAYSWGWNKDGQLGLAQSPDQSMAALPTPIDICDNEEDLCVVQVACGGRHSVCLVDGGAVYVFGWNGCGQLGLGDILTRRVPSLVSRISAESVECGACCTLVTVSRPT